MRESSDSQKAVFATGAEHVTPKCQRGARRRQAGTGGTATAPRRRRPRENDAAVRRPIFCGIWRF
ncbi:MAG: hypothetical protein J6X49_08280 [Victivallales bacterium]|nr:hypothetical protein [Victivallales bacterium]